MAILPIRRAGDPVLREKARRVRTVDKSIHKLIEDMWETMYDAPGVGLAAPQVGVSMQLAVIEDPEEYLSHLTVDQLAATQRAAVPFHVIINPKLTFTDDSRATFFEGCLSVEGYQAIVERALNVRVECLNERGEEIAINAHGWYARILQHEIDHLNGTLYIDRMKTRTLTTGENMLRYWNNKSIDQVLADVGDDQRA